MLSPLEPVDVKQAEMRGRLQPTDLQRMVAASQVDPHLSLLTDESLQAMRRSIRTVLQGDAAADANAADAADADVSDTCVSNTISVSSPLNHSCTYSTKLFIFICSFNFQSPEHPVHNQLNKCKFVFYVLYVAH